jgi:hypothetical protein
MNFACGVGNLDGCIEVKINNVVPVVSHRLYHATHKPHHAKTAHVASGVSGTYRFVAIRLVVGAVPGA